MLATCCKARLGANSLFAVGLLLASCALANGDDHLNDAAVTGTWKVVSAELRGEPMEVPPESYFVFTDGDVTLVGNGARLITFGTRFDLAKDPPHFDTIAINLSSVSVRQKGIYVIDGKTMKWCLSSDDEERPTDFTTDPSSNRSLRILKRWDGAKKKVIPDCKIGS